MQNRIRHRAPPDQVSLFQPPDRRPQWSTLPTEVKDAVTGLLARLLREHGSRVVATASAEDDDE
jgi:hypothetical protein